MPPWDGVMKLKLLGGRKAALGRGNKIEITWGGGVMKLKLLGRWGGSAALGRGNEIKITLGGGGA